MKCAVIAPIEIFFWNRWMVEPRPTLAPEHRGRALFP